MAEIENAAPERKGPHPAYEAWVKRVDELVGMNEPLPPMVDAAWAAVLARVENAHVIQKQHFTFRGERVQALDHPPLVRVHPKNPYNPMFMMRGMDTRILRALATKYARLAIAETRKAKVAKIVRDEGRLVPRNESVLTKEEMQGAIKLGMSAFTSHLENLLRAWMQDRVGTGWGVMKSLDGKRPSLAEWRVEADKIMKKIIEGKKP